MQPLVCDMCRGTLVMDPSGEFAVCEYCGMKYTKQHVQQKIQAVRGTVEVFQGEAEKERILANGETFLKLKEWDKALEAFKSVTEQYPDEYRGWWGLVRIAFLFYGGSRDIVINASVGNSLANMDINLEHAYSLCPDKGIITSFLKEFFSTYVLCDAPYGSGVCYISENLSCQDNSGIILQDETCTFPKGLHFFTLKLLNPKRMDLWNKLGSEEVIEAWKNYREMYFRGFWEGEFLLPYKTSRIVFPEAEQAFESIRQQLNSDLDMLTELMCLCGVRVEKADKGDRIYYDHTAITVGTLLPKVIGLRAESNAGGYWDRNLLILSKPVTEYINEINTRRQLRQQGRCPYCGGEFKGWLTKKCSVCGREKDY